MTILTLLGLLVPPAASQKARPAQEPPRPMSASLLRRLAAAADGYRTGAPVWIVASYDRPNPVAGAFPDSLSAARAATELRSRGPYAVFGPYVTPQDFDRPPVLILAPHWPPTIRDNVDSMVRRLPEAPWLVRDIDSLALVVYHRERAPLRVAMPYPPDALFFTLSAIDKFAVPYYTDLDGTAGVSQWRDSLAAYVRRAPLR
jgi:hypothetical protein